MRFCLFLSLMGVIERAIVKKSLNDHLLWDNCNHYKNNSGDVYLPQF